MKKEIALISPKQQVSKIKKLFLRKWPPLELLNAATLLREEGFSVNFIDAYSQNLSDQEIIARTKNSSLCFLITSPIDRWQCPTIEITSTLKLAKRLKNLYLVGPHGTIDPKKFLKETQCKGVILGEPELAILNICKGKIPPSRKIISTDLIDINRLNPALDLISLRDYFYEFLGNNFTLLELSRGCPFSCPFCFKSMYKGYRTKNLHIAIKQIEMAVEKYKFKNIYFIDLEFVIDKTFIKKLCRKIITKRLSFNWACQTRLDSLDQELLDLMNDAGCKVIHVGIETGSNYGQESIANKVNFKKDRLIIEYAKRKGIDIVGFFILGFTDNIVKEFQETLNLAKELNPTFASFHTLIPYPNTKIADKMGWDIFKNKGKAKEHFAKYKQYERKALYRFYLNPRKIFEIIKRPMRLTQKFRLFLSYFL